MKCSRCQKDLTEAVNLLGYAVVRQAHEAAHNSEDVQKLKEFWFSDADPVETEFEVEYYEWKRKNSK